MTQEQEEQQKHHEYTRLIEDMGLVRAIDYLLGQKSASHTATLLERIDRVIDTPCACDADDCGRCEELYKLRKTLNQPK